MEPHVQFVKTADGVNIAYTTYGDGEPLVWFSNPAGSHVQLEWEQQPLTRAGITLMTEQQRRVVRFDQRGVGLSDRDVDDVSLDARVSDVEAVVDGLGLGAFDIFAAETGGHPAIAYAAKHPERVERLVLLNCYARGSEASETTRGQALANLQTDWHLLTDVVGANSLGMNSEDARGYGAFLRECLTHEMWLRLDQAEHDIDVSGLLPQVQAPTLIVRHSGIEWLSMDATRELAAAISDARLVLIEGLYPDNYQQLVGSISRFLGVEEPPVMVPDAAPAPQDVHTILFTDMQSSSALTRQLGDAKAQELKRVHNDIVRRSLRTNGGSEVKHTGDGIMASFPSASQALASAIAIQRGVASHVEAHPESPLGIYIGLNAGEPIAEDDDLFGTSVDLARRICDHAQPGQILASNVVRELAAGKSFLFSDISEVVPKGFDEPVRLYELRWRED